MRVIEKVTCTVMFITALAWGNAARCHADCVLDWNEVALAQMSAAQQLPPDGARSLAMVHVAMFDALNAIEPRYQPYAFHGRARRGAAAEAAAAAAARGVLVTLFGERAQVIEAAYADALARVPDEDARQAGVEIGQAAAAACLARRKGDGSDAQAAYKPRTSPGVYVPTALPLGAQWGAVRPFLLQRGSELRPRAPLDLRSAQWARDFDEIKRLGGRQSTARSADQTEVARFWAMTGPVAWNPVVRALCSAARLSTLDDARLFALVYMAATDAFIAVFDAKYTYEFWRPITAIRNGADDGNAATEPEATWLPLIDTPMHPEYPCAHCISAGAVGEVLEAQFGRGEVEPFAMTSTTAPGVTHRWHRISDYVTEVGNARVWGGVHYRSSTEVGEAMGRRIGALAVHDYLTPTAGRESGKPR